MSNHILFILTINHDVVAKRRKDLLEGLLMAIALSALHSGFSDLNMLSTKKMVPGQPYNTLFIP